MNLNFVFKSHNHLRYKNGHLVGGPDNGATRAVKVEPNINGCEGYNIKEGEGYIVTIFNLDGNHPVWNNNVQMTPKPMKIISQSSDKILLRGYPVKALSPLGWVDFAGQNYGLTIFYKKGDVDKCVMHMYDRYLDIEYLKDQNPQIKSEPEIVSLAQRANAQYQDDRVTDGRQLLFQVYRSVKSDPGLLRNVTSYSSLGTSFLIMLELNLSDNIDTLQMMASLSYLCFSKAIVNDPDNLDLYKSRLLMLNIGNGPFRYTVWQALDLIPLCLSGSDALINSRDEIYKMEISDLVLHPSLCVIDIFKQRKEEFDKMIGSGFFAPETTLEEVCKVGIANHNKLLNYLDNKVINEEDTDF